MAEFYNSILSIVNTAYVTVLCWSDSLKLQSLSLFTWSATLFNKLVTEAPTSEEIIVWVKAFPEAYATPALASLKASPESIKTFIAVKSPLVIQWIKTSPSIYGPLILNWCTTRPLAISEWVTTIAIPYLSSVSWLTWLFAVLTLMIDVIIILRAYYYVPVKLQDEFVELFEKNIKSSIKNPFAFGSPKSENSDGEEGSHRTKADKCPFGFGNKDKDGNTAEVPEGHPPVPTTDETAKAAETTTKIA